jgi:D-sedoheptulose 7-phosphate isomerase
MEKVVFTNGCFDIIHAGHVDLLRRARALGSKLVVGINSDESVRSIKGPRRPFVPQDERAAVLKAFDSVDEVVIFDETTPERIIEEIRPDVLVKGGDWKEDEIIGASFVKENGGDVFSLPLHEEFSSTSIVDRIKSSNGSGRIEETEKKSITGSAIREHQEVFSALEKECAKAIDASGDIIAGALLNGNKVLICGNGGSAADSQHIAAEFVGRYESERIALPAIALTTDTSALTALSNDYGFERIFERQVEALAASGDVLIAISTSGESPNVTAAVMKAREKGCKTIGLTGVNGKKLASLSDVCVIVPSARTSRIQEAHATIGHIWCEIVDHRIAKH